MKTFRSGLVSVTFRQLAPKQIVDLCREAAVEGIEWGGDIHVPHGKIDVAKEVRKITEDAGLVVAAYGSYYRVGTGQMEFQPVLDTAVALGTPNIRVWCGARGSKETYGAGRQQAVDELRRCCELAVGAGRTVVCEWHGGTLTDTAASASALFTEVNHPALKTYWQPRSHAKPDFSLADMDAALPHLAGLHVFNWHPETAERLALADGAADWAQYLAKAAPAVNSPLFALIEFVRDERPAQFLEDAKALNAWLCKS